MWTKMWFHHIKVLLPVPWQKKKKTVSWLGANLGLRSVKRRLSVCYLVWFKSRVNARMMVRKSYLYLRLCLARAWLRVHAPLRHKFVWPEPILFWGQPYRCTWAFIGAQCLGKLVGQLSAQKASATMLRICLSPSDSRSNSHDLGIFILSL